MAQTGGVLNVPEAAHCEFFNPDVDVQTGCVGVVGVVVLSSRMGEEGATAVPFRFVSLVFVDGLAFVCCCCLLLFCVAPNVGLPFPLPAATARTVCWPSPCAQSAMAA